MSQFKVVLKLDITDHLGAEVDDRMALELLADAFEEMKKVHFYSHEAIEIESIEVAQDLEFEETSYGSMKMTKPETPQEEN